MSRPFRLPGLVLTMAAAGVLTLPAHAQVVVRSGTAQVEFTGRFHTQFNTTSTSNAVSTEWLVRRARFTANITVNDFISGRIMPEFGEGSVKLRDGWVRLTFSPGVHLTLGQFKRPFDLFQLTSSTKILVIERAGSIRGVNACTGIGGVCTLSNLTESLGFSDRDVGALAEIHTDRVTYQVAVTNGTGANTPDENGTKSYTGRVVVAASDALRIGGNLALKDYVDVVGADDDFALGYGADLEIGTFDSGIHLQAGVSGGQNWANPDISGDPSNFLTFQGILTYRYPVNNAGHVSALEPVGRLSVADPDLDAENDLGILFTPGLMVHFIGRNKVAANIDVWVPDGGETEWSFKLQTYLHF